MDQNNSKHGHLCCERQNEKEKGQFSIRREQHKPEKGQSPTRRRLEKEEKNQYNGRMAMRG